MVCLLFFLTIGGGQGVEMPKGGGGRRLNKGSGPYNHTEANSHEMNLILTKYNKNCNMFIF